MSLVNTVSAAFVPIHRAGWPFIAIFFVFSFILGAVWSPLFYLGLALTAWCAYFFRDPERVTPLNDDWIISPADGIISAIGPAVPPDELDMEEDSYMRISVFMNVFSVHINRSPFTGTVEKIAYSKGKFFNADLDKASRENERNGLIIKGEKGSIGVVQVAGLVARRILCFVRTQDTLSAGERFGLIRFGSRLDLYLPADVSVNVAVGQTAIAGETVLAHFTSNSSLSVTKTITA